MGQTTKDKKVLKLLIDCNALCYKAFYVLPQTLSFKEKDTNIIFGFLSQIKKLAEDFETNQFIFCWDSPKSYRRMVYPEYKANRLDGLTDVQRENLRIAKNQFVELREDVLPWMGFKQVYCQNGYEADDIIAWFAIRQPWNYVIVSGDEDLHQLLYDNDYAKCQIWNGRKLFTLENWRIGTGMDNPAKWALVKAIAGCSTDNVKGVEGAGELKAIKYILGTLPDGKIKKKIEESKDLIQRNMSLVHLPYVDGAKELWPLEDYPDDDELYSVDFMETFREFGLRSFLGDGFEKWRDVFKLNSGRGNGKTS